MYFAQSELQGIERVLVVLHILFQTSLSQLGGLAFIIPTLLPSCVLKLPSLMCLA